MTQKTQHDCIMIQTVLKDMYHSNLYLWPSIDDSRKFFIFLGHLIAFGVKGALSQVI